MQTRTVIISILMIYTTSTAAQSPIGDTLFEFLLSQREIFLNEGFPDSLKPFTFYIDTIDYCEGEEISLLYFFAYSPHAKVYLSLVKKHSIEILTGPLQLDISKSIDFFHQYLDCFDNKTILLFFQRLLIANQVNERGKGIKK